VHLFQLFRTAQMDRHRFYLRPFPG